MEGVLWKWTNYFSGWQPRWFVLDNGVLSYYKSQEDVNNGCKGSIKISVCDIVVHPTDPARVDLIIPGEQHYYVKAATTKERQAWLVALGSAKANDGVRLSESEDITPDSLRSKKSELRLYCDLLMQQVHSVKHAVNTEEQPNTDKLNEATSLLSATCDTFIQTLEDCMQLAKSISNPAVAETPSPVPPSPTRTNRKGSRNMSRSSSVEKNIPIKLSPVNSYESMSAQSRSKSRPRSSSESSFSETEISNGTVRPPRPVTTDSQVIYEVDSSKESQANQGDYAGIHGLDRSNNHLPSPRIPNSVPRSEEGEGSEVFKDAIDSKLPTFFSTMRPSFTDVNVMSDNGIHVETFLGACRSLVPIFDKLNGTAFAPVKMDFNGNIRKIHQKFTTYSGKFTSLQEMIQFEVKAKQHTNSNSATVALLWLSRGLRFVLEFLREFCSGQFDLTLCATNAYSRTLKPYHGWVIRGVFAVAVKALPYRNVFFSHLAAVDCDTESSLFHHSLNEDCERFIHALSSVIDTINAFYANNNLHLEDPV